MKTTILFFILIPVLVWSNVLFAQPENPGLLFDEDRYSEIPLKVKLIDGEYDNLPPYASLKSFCPKPGNQLQLGTAAAWATTWGAMTIIQAKHEGWLDNNEITHKAYSPIFIYNKVRLDDDDRCLKGTTLMDILAALKNSGTAQYADYQEFCPSQFSTMTDLPDKVNAIAEFVRLYDDAQSKSEKIKTIKKAVVEDMPVVIGMLCPPSFYTAKGVWEPEELAQPFYNGHALCVVGYDDQKYGGAFEVLNSWGSNWGNDGFIWIKYADLVKYTLNAFEIYCRHEDDHTNIGGEISLQLQNGKILPLQYEGNNMIATVEPLTKGDRFNLKVISKYYSYVYAFGTDETNDIFNVFPLLANESALVGYSNSRFVIPKPGHFIELDDIEGTDYLCVVVSKQPLPMNVYLSSISQSDEHIISQLKKEGFPNTESENGVEVTNGTIKYKMNDVSRDSILLIIKINHI